MALSRLIKPRIVPKLFSVRRGNLTNSFLDCLISLLLASTETDFNDVARKTMADKIRNLLKDTSQALPVPTGFRTVKAQAINQIGQLDVLSYNFFSGIWNYDAANQVLTSDFTKALQDKIQQIYQGIEFSFSSKDKTQFDQNVLNQQAANLDLFNAYNTLFPKDKINGVDPDGNPLLSLDEKNELVRDKIYGWYKDPNEKVTDINILSYTTATARYNAFPGANTQTRRDLLDKYFNSATLNPLQITKTNNDGLLAQLQGACEPRTLLSDQTTKGLQFFVDPAEVKTALSGLLNQSNSIDVEYSFDKTNTSDSTKTVNYSGSAGLVASYSFLSFSAGGSGSSERKTSAFEIHSKGIKIKYSFKGYGKYSVQPAPFKAGATTANATGWLDSDTITAAVRNYGKDITGYKLASDQFQPADFKKLGKFGLSVGVCLTNVPDITITYTTNDVKRTSDELKKSFSVNSGVSFFGLFHVGGSTTQSSTNTVSSFEQTQTDVTVRFPAVKFDLTQNPNAYVFGVVPTWPGDTA